MALDGHSVRCRDIGIPPTVSVAVKDGTKPEELRIELHCSHGKVLIVPFGFDVPVLCHIPESCAEVLGVQPDKLFTTGPFL